MSVGEAQGQERWITTLPGVRRTDRPSWNSHHTIVRTTPAWREWLGEFAHAARTNRSELVGAALALLAETHGFRPPPSRV
jgi:hypothetical protein